MASTITPTQIRINDPYQQTVFQYNTTDSKVYISRESNKILNVIGNDLVLKGLYMSDPVIVPTSTVSVNISAGWAIQDETLLEITDSSTLDIDCAALVDTDTGGAHLGIFINYQYIETVEPNLVSIDLFHIQTDGTVTDPLGRFTAACRILLGIINFTKIGPTVVAVSRNDFSSLVINGSIYYVRGLGLDNVVLPNLFETAFKEYREYLLKRDYLLSE